MRKQVATFLLVGGLTAAIDYTCYRSIVWTTLLTPNLAKGVGFFAGTVFAYFANRYWTFERHPHHSGGTVRFFILYAATMITNMATNAKMLELLGIWNGAVQISFVVATAVSATLNFFGMKFFIFIHPVAKP